MFKKINKFTNLLFIVVWLSIALISGCNSDGFTSDDIVVSLNLDVAGTLDGSPTVKYRSANNSIQSETLTLGNWSKSFTVKPGFKLYLEVSGGTIQNGRVNLSIDAREGSSSKYSNTQNNTSTGSPYDLDLLVETTLN